MIVGIGTDMATVSRFAKMLESKGPERAAGHLLAESELAEFAAAGDPARFLAKRFAAKEALSKALGTGIRSPVLFTAIAIVHDELGKPDFAFNKALTEFVCRRGVTRFHLSITDERDQALAFVVAEAG